MGLLQLTFLCIAAFFTCSCSPEGAWDLMRFHSDGSPSAFRIKLTFLNNSQSENLDDFPVLVALTPQRVTYSNLNSDGTDIPYNPQPADVWSNGYAGVWHLQESQETLRDSTINGNHGVNFGTVTAMGRMGGGRFFDGSDDFINCGNGSSLEITGEISLSAWVKPATDPYSVMRIVSKKAAWDAPAGYGLAIDPTTEEIHHLGSGGWPFGTGIAPNINQDLQFIAGTTIGTSSLVYWNGDEVTTLFTNFALAADAENLCIGRIPGAPPPNADFFYGIIDEVRVSNTIRSPDWYRAQYKSMTDTFLEYGTEEKAGD